jgi:hypothetical protein
VVGVSRATIVAVTPLPAIERDREFPSMWHQPASSFSPFRPLGTLAPLNRG